jgi:hypothetical protein
VVLLVGRSTFDWSAEMPTQRRYAQISAKQNW